VSPTKAPTTARFDREKFEADVYDPSEGWDGSHSIDVPVSKMVSRWKEDLYGASTEGCLQGNIQENGFWCKVKRGSDGGDPTCRAGIKSPTGTACCPRSCKTRDYGDYGRSQRYKAEGYGDYGWLHWKSTCGDSFSGEDFNGKDSVCSPTYAAEQGDCKYFAAPCKLDESHHIPKATPNPTPAPTTKKEEISKRKGKASPAPPASTEPDYFGHCTCKRCGDPHDHGGNVCWRGDDNSIPCNSDPKICSVPGSFCECKMATAPQYNCWEKYPMGYGNGFDTGQGCYSDDTASGERCDCLTQKKYIPGQPAPITPPPTTAPTMRPTTEAPTPPPTHAPTPAPTTEWKADKCQLFKGATGEVRTLDGVSIGPSPTCDGNVLHGPHPNPNPPPSSEGSAS
jgi:hypothetical protein